MRWYRERQNSRQVALLPQSDTQQREPVAGQQQWKQTTMPAQTSVSLVQAPAATIPLKPTPLSCLEGSWLAMRCTLAPAGNGKDSVKRRQKSHSNKYWYLLV